MKKLNLTIQCMSVYNSSIWVPDDMSFKEAIAYAKEHLHEAPLGVLEYVSDSDQLDEENCDFDYSNVVQIIVTNIKWDAPKSAKLPSQVVIDITEDNKYLLEDIDGAADNLSDYLSDTFEYCHKGFATSCVTATES